MRFFVLALVAACTVGDGSSRPAPLAPLPPASPVMTSQFRDAEACGQCHLAPDGTAVLHDAAGDNVSPVMLWRSSMMALAVRDPYYLSVFAEELASAPDRRDAIEPLCTRCHAPAGSIEQAAIGFDDLVAGTSDAAVLGRGGVTCTLCHQIAASGLGDESSFSGGFTVGFERMIYGRYPNPPTSPMQLIVDYTPTLGTHVASSELCATCHVVIVPTATGRVVEQATFLEWRASSFAGTAGQACQGCHVPVTDDAGAAIAAAVSVFPADLPIEQPVGRHVFVGGNSYVLSLLDDAGAWAGANLPAGELAASAARDVAHLGSAARVTVADAHRDPDGTAVVTIRVENKTGHKLPTGYPSRRMWLHVTASAGGQVVFESGRADASGAIVDPDGHPLPRQSHLDAITGGDQAQIWEAILIDDHGAPTHRALAAIGYDKDDRILPAGFAPTGLDVERTAPIGTGLDANFVAGSDDVTYRIANAPANLALAIDLCYEALRPEIVDAIDASATPAGTTFVDLARARPVTPVVMAHLDASL